MPRRAAPSSSPMLRVSAPCWPGPATVRSSRARTLPTRSSPFGSEESRWTAISKRVFWATSAPKATRGGLLLCLQLGVVLANEGADVLGHVQKLRPLLFVQRHRESTEAVHRNPALLAHFQAGGSLRVSPAQCLIFRPETLHFRLQLLLAHGQPSV